MGLAGTRVAADLALEVESKFLPIGHQIAV